ncbi:hypothetical protein [Qipengyuania sp. JC766]|uniref:hypothetical protein n=1 Tax=Qipengyuania sp. JC766 TaxID=3232139 RepID=UPI003458B4DE
MAALGCFLFLALPIIGVVLGGWLAGPDGALAGGVAGFALALAATALSFLGLWKAGKRR